MDYTTVDNVKREMQIHEDGVDDLLADLVTRASRTLDRLCGRSIQASNYFMKEDVVDEVLTARYNVDRHLLCWPHKVVVNSIKAFAYRRDPRENWYDVDPSIVTVTRMVTTEAWLEDAYLSRLGRGYMVKVSYNGGFDTSCSGANFPQDFVEIATLLAGRFYREAEGGMNDAMGIAELGTLTYTKALPQRVKETVKNYIRMVPW